MCDKPTLYHSNNTGSKDQHTFIHKLIQCDDIHKRGGAHIHIEEARKLDTVSISSLVGIIYV